MDSDRKEQLKGLRELVSWLGKHPEYPIPYWLTFQHSLRVKTDTELVAARKALGKCDKVFTDTVIGFEHSFAGGISLRATIERNEVCERVVVGQRRVPAYEVPAHDEPIYEYKCPESLLVALGEGAA